MIKRKAQAPAFGERLVLFRYFLDLFGKKTLADLAGKLNQAEFEGCDENQNTYFYGYLKRLCAAAPNSVKISADRLRQYDENICRHVRRIGEKREGGLVLKYFQYLALLFTEIYLDRYFTDRAAFLADLNAFLDRVREQTQGELKLSPFTEKEMNKLAFMCATGSGKTLLMHMHILQFLHYIKKAQRRDSHLQINRILVLAPNESMSRQHLDELTLSSIPAAIFDKNKSWLLHREQVVILDMNKLKEEGKVKTVSIDSFEQNNLVLVDEAHRGLVGDVWYEYRSRLSCDGGFAFEYSATFKQALCVLNLSREKEKKLADEYCRSILMDYSYRYFYRDGYGKEYRIYNLRESADKEQSLLYLTGCLLSFYQQLKLYEMYQRDYAPFQVQKPLLVFVGNRVTARLGGEELTDVETVLDFLDQFVGCRDVSIRRLQAILEEDTGLVDGAGYELFSQSFQAVKSLFGGHARAKEVYQDLLRAVFHCGPALGTPRLHVEQLRQIPGEIALRIGEDGKYFGVINIGDSAALIRNCDKRGIVASTEEFLSDSLFERINRPESDVQILIGSRKFTEGWNSWRVSAMGLINFAKGEGAQAIQLFGRGVRLKGYNGCLKRSSMLDDSTVRIPKWIGLLETLTVFGVRAQYMEEFKQYLELEDVPANENVHMVTLPVHSRFNEIQEKRLRVIKVRAGANFKKQAKRLLLTVPDEGFMRYLTKNRVVLDCRSRVQTIESAFSFGLRSITEEHTLEKRYIPYLDFERIFEELEAYKNEKLYYNISLIKENLKAILETEGWYSLIIPPVFMQIDSMEELEAAADFCIMALKGYMDRFYKYEHEKWEAPLLEYQDLTESDNNFVSEYVFSYSPSHETDDGAQCLEQFAGEVTAQIETDGRLTAYETSIFSGRLTAFDFGGHLYAPLIHVKQDGLNLQVSPVSLNRDEKGFVDLLKQYSDANPAVLKGKNLYLLRNKSKTGMGFFEAGNFYPDFILWIDTPKIQYVSFIDPKGLLRVTPDDPKIQFYKTIKGLEARLQPTAGDKQIILNSFILSGTKSAELRAWWKMERPEREARHVFCLDNDGCVERMIERIMEDPNG